MTGAAPQPDARPPPPPPPKRVFREHAPRIGIGLGSFFAGLATGLGLAFSSFLAGFVIGLSFAELVARVFA